VHTLNSHLSDFQKYVSLCLGLEKNNKPCIDKNHIFDLLGANIYSEETMEG